MTLYKLKQIGRQYWIPLAVFLILFASYCSARLITGLLFPQQTVSLQQIASIPGGLKDYSVSADGTLESISFDPWVYLEYDSLGIKKPVTVSFHIEAMQDEDPEFLMYYVDSYLFQSAEKKVGANTLPLLYRSSADQGIRFDFTTLEGQSIKLASFVFNDNGILTANFREKIILLSIYWGLFLLIGLASTHVCFLPPVPACAGSSGKYGLYAGSAALYIFLGAAVSLTSCGSSSLSLMLKWGTCLFMAGAAWIIIQCGIKKAHPTSFLLKLVCRLLIILLILLLFQIGVRACLFEYTAGEWGNYIRNDFLSLSMAANMLLVISLYTAIACILGFGWASLISGAAFVVLLVGNGIKIYFQKELLSIADFFLLKEVFGIAKYFISLQVLLPVLILSIFLCWLVIRSWPKIKRALTPSCSFKNLWLLFPCLAFLSALSLNQFRSIGIDAKKEYRLTQDAVSDYGIGIYYYYMFTKGISTPVPDGYGPDIVSNVAAYQEPAVSPNVQPNVVLILAESLFRADQIPDIQFNCDLFENTRKYIKATAISPSYGGRTAAAEFEALTGYSDYFLSGDTIAYTTYITNPKRNLGSLAQEFRNAGYRTIAMHPNRADYYNRNVVYESMGFDTFLDITAFDTSPDNMLEDGFLKDEAFFDVMIRELENSNEPVFLFGATIAGHSPYGDKYTETQVHASSPLYSSNALTELSRFGQAAYDLDQQLGRLFDYLDQCDTPTFVFVFGDHLPPLEIYAQSNFLKNAEIKYSTPVIVYSNDTEVNMPETFSLSYLAPIILKTSGIPHRAYFDFLYKFGQTCPVLHKEFPVTANKEELNLYEKIQYDSLFGENYLLSGTIP